MFYAVPLLLAILSILILYFYIKSRNQLVVVQPQSSEVHTESESTPISPKKDKLIYDLKIVGWPKQLNCKPTVVTTEDNTSSNVGKEQFYVLAKTRDEQIVSIDELTEHEIRILRGPKKGLSIDEGTPAFDKDRGIPFIISGSIPGSYKVQFLFGQQAITEEIEITDTIDAKDCSFIVTEPTKAEVSVQLSYRIKKANLQTRIQYADRKPTFKALIISPSGKKFNPPIMYILDEAVISYIPEESGHHLVYFACVDQGFQNTSDNNNKGYKHGIPLSQTLSGCPFTFDARSYRPSAKHSIMYGAGLLSGEPATSEQRQFFVSIKDIYGNDLEPHIVTEIFEMNNIEVKFVGLPKIIPNLKPNGSLIEVSYVAKKAGTYSVHVLLAVSSTDREHINSSPLTLTIKPSPQPHQLKLHSNLTNPNAFIPAGTRLMLYVSSFDKFDNPQHPSHFTYNQLSVKCLPHHEDTSVNIHYIPIDVLDSDTDGIICEIEVRQKTSGRYRLHVYFGDKEITGSPYCYNVSNEVISPQKCQVQYNSNVKVGLEEKIHISTFDSFGNKIPHGGCKFKLKALLPLGSFNEKYCSAIDNNDGTYFLQYTPVVRGQISLAVYLIQDLEEKLIGGTLDILGHIGERMAWISNEPSSSHSADDIFIAEIVTMEADGRITEFPLRLFEYAIDSPSDSTSNSAIEITSLKEGKYELRARITKIGSYKLIVKFNGKTVKGTPMMIAVVPGKTYGFEAEITRASGAKTNLPEFSVGARILVELKAIDKWNNYRPLGRDRIDLYYGVPKGQSIFLNNLTTNDVKSWNFQRHVNLVDRYDGTYCATIKSTVAGEHTCIVFLQDKAVNKLDFKLNPGVADVSKLLLKEDTAVSADEAQQGLNAFLVLRDRFENKTTTIPEDATFSATLCSAYGDEQTPLLLRAVDGGYSIVYSCTIASTYELKVSAKTGKQQEIYKIQIVVKAGKTCAKRCECQGEAMAPAILFSSARSATFTIIAKDSFENYKYDGGDKFYVDIHPSRQTGRILDNKDGNYLVTCDIQQPGDHIIQVYLANEPNRREEVTQFKVEVLSEQNSTLSHRLNWLKGRLHQLGLSRSKVELAVRRSNIYEDSMREFFTRPHATIKQHNIKISYIGEAGLDGGGLLVWFTCYRKNYFFRKTGPPI